MNAIILLLLTPPLFLLGYIFERSPEALASQLRLERERAFTRAWNQLYGSPALAPISACSRASSRATR